MLPGLGVVALRCVAQTHDLRSQSVGRQRASGDDGDPARLVDSSHLFAADVNATFMRERLSNAGGEGHAIDRQGMSGRNRGGARDRHQQRPGASHFFFQQPGSGVFAVRLQGIGANQLGEIGGLVRGSRARRPHLAELDVESAAGALPGGFRSGKAGSDDRDRSHFAFDVFRERRGA